MSSIERSANAASQRRLCGGRQGRVHRARREQIVHRLEHAILHDRLGRDQVQVAGQDVLRVGAGALGQRAPLRTPGTDRQGARSGPA